MTPGAGPARRLVEAVGRALRSLAALFALCLGLLAAAHVGGRTAGLPLVTKSFAPSVARAADATLAADYGRFAVDSLGGLLGPSGSNGVALVVARSPTTLALVLPAVVIALLAGVPLGLWAGLGAHRAAGRAIAIGALAAASLPAFWVGVLLVTFVGSGLAAARDTPAIATLALPLLASVVRVVYCAARAEASRGYAWAARARGIAERRIVAAHLLPHVVATTLPALARLCATALVLSTVVETVFARPGIGKLFVEAIAARDAAVVAAYAFAMAGSFVAIRLAFDLGAIALAVRGRRTPRDRPRERMEASG